MLINFHNQNHKNYLFYAPEAPKAPVEDKGDQPEKPNDSSKPDYTDKKIRDNLYKQVEATIAKLRQSPDKNNWKTAKDLEHSLKTAKQNDTMKMVSPELAANNLHDRLTAILHPKMSDAEVAKLSAKLEALANPKKVSGKTKAVPGVVSFEADKITSMSSEEKKAARAAALSDAASFGMIGLLKDKVEPSKKGPEIVLKVTIIEAPKPAPLGTKVPASDVPQPVQLAMRNFVSGDNGLGFSGAKYLESSDGNVWKANVKPGKGDAQGTIGWEKVTV